MFQTENDFTLPKGLVDEAGGLHQHGVMRLATAADEIVPLKDPRVERNPAYFSIILLSRVVTKLGDLKHINPKTIEDLFSEDLKYLENLYNEINGHNGQMTVTCPDCRRQFEVETNGLGGS